MVKLIVQSKFEVFNDIIELWGRRMDLPKALLSNLHSRRACGTASSIHGCKVHTKCFENFFYIIFSFKIYYYFFIFLYVLGCL